MSELLRNYPLSIHGKLVVSFLVVIVYICLSRAGVDISLVSSSSESDSSDESEVDLPPPDLEFSDDEETEKEEAEKTQEPNKSDERDKKADEEKGKEKKSEESKTRKTDEVKVEKEFEPIDLDKIEVMEDLLNLGLDHLKWDLRRREMKCGGTLEERAKRLWQLKFPAAEEPPVKRSKKQSSK